MHLADVVSPASSRDAAIAALFRDHYTRLVRLAFVMTSDAGLAEELAQEAFVRCHQSWRQIREEESAPAYLRATVVNLARSSLRRRLLEARHRSSSKPLDAASGQERLDFIRALQTLPAKQRACIALRYYEDLSEADTAKALGVSVGTVKSQTHRALARLKELLGD